MTELAVCDIITKSFANETVILFEMYAVIRMKGDEYDKGYNTFEFLIIILYKFSFSLVYILKKQND